MYQFFLCSSSEQLPIAEAMRAGLDAQGLRAELWSSGAHGANQYNLEALVAAAKRADFAVFVFGADDQVTIRGKAVAVVRDNVLFELGVFTGVLGRERCFIVQGTDPDLHMPSDLEGITTLKHSAQAADDDIVARLDSLVKSLLTRARAVAAAGAAEFTPNDVRLLEACSAPSMPSNQAWKAFGAAPASWDDKLCMRFVRLLQKGLIQRTGTTEVEWTRSGRLLANARAESTRAEP